MSDEDGFWSGRAGDEPDPAAQDGPPREDGSALTPAAQSVIAGFLTGGLTGLVQAIEAERGGASFEDDVDDPEALRQAEDEVAGRGREPAGQRPPSAQRIDEPWTVVATQLNPKDTAGLDDVVRSLQSDGIDCGWDLYDPRDTVNFLPPSAGLTARKLFSVLVPVSQLSRARDCLFGSPPRGVTYAWSVDEAKVSGSAAPAQDALPDAGTPRERPRPTSKDGILLSDNAHIERMARGGTPGSAWIIAVATVIALVVAVALLAIRG